MMTRTLKAFINDGVCSRITSNFDRIEVDGETVWRAGEEKEPMTMFPRAVKSITFEPSSFVDGKMPGQKKEMREVTVNVCKECGTELEYDAPTYTCPECGETYSFKTAGVAGPW